MRPRGVSTAALNFDKDGSGSRVADCRAKLPCRHILNRANMSAEDHVHVVDDARPDHFGSTLDRFLGRLEEELQRAAADIVLQAACRCKQHCRVAVVPAGVNAAGLAVNYERKRIHIRTKHHHGTGFLAANDAENPGCSAHIAVGLNPECFKLLCNIRGGLLFMERKFGHLVKFAAKRLGIINLCHKEYSERNS